MEKFDGGEINRANIERRKIVGLDLSKKDNAVSVPSDIKKENRGLLRQKIEQLRNNVLNELGEVSGKDQVNIDNELQNKTDVVEVKREFVDLVILEENSRYQSQEAFNRAGKIDKDFPASGIGKILNKYKSQERNLQYINPNPTIHIGDWLDEGEGGHYRQQPELVSRSKDFIQLSSKADSDQLKQILAHEYNHMITQGESNFSDKYKKYIRSILKDEKELKALKKNKEYEILFEEPYKGAGPVYKYLTSPAEINAYLGTNLRNDLLRNGIIKNFYDKINEDMIDMSPELKDSNCTREKTPVYKIYLSIIKDKKKLINWLNDYAI